VSVASILLSLVLAAMPAASAVLDILRPPQLVEAIAVVGVPVRLLPALAVVKVCGVVGLLVGLAVPAVGLVTAAGAVVYFALAVAAHLRVHDRAIAPALTFGAVALAALVVIAQSHGVPTVG
jgi:hypothetical protein